MLQDSREELDAAQSTAGDRRAEPASVSSKPESTTGGQSNGTKVLQSCSFSTEDHSLTYYCVA